MHRSNKSIISTIIFVLAFCFSLPAQSKGFYMELYDYVNRDLNKIYLDTKQIKISGKREIKIIDVKNSKVSYLNPRTNTMHERSFANLLSIDRINRKYNMDSAAISRKERTSDIKVISAKTVKLKNKPYNAIVLKYGGASSGTKTILAANSQFIKETLGKMIANPVISKIFSEYFSSDEMGMLKHGFIPFRTQKLYNLRAFYGKNLPVNTFNAPQSYSKKSTGDYYRDYAIKLMGKGS